MKVIDSAKTFLALIGCFVVNCVFLTAVRPQGGAKFFVTVYLSHLIHSDSIKVIKTQNKYSTIN